VEKWETRATGASLQPQVEKRETRAMGAAGVQNKHGECGATKMSPVLANCCTSGLDLIALVILSRSWISHSESESGIAG
jgi:hypothetical protein